MATVGRKQVNTEKRRLIDARQGAVSEKRLYVKVSTELFLNRMIKEVLKLPSNYQTSARSLKIVLDSASCLKN